MNMITRPTPNMKMKTPTSFSIHEHLLLERESVLLFIMSSLLLSVILDEGVIFVDMRVVGCVMVVAETGVGATTVDGDAS